MTPHTSDSPAPAPKPAHPPRGGFARALLPALLAVGLWLAPAVALCADAISFHTAEYMKISKSGASGKSAFDWIHADVAYAAGFTGEGVRIAFLDGNAYTGHSEFQGKSYTVSWAGQTPQPSEYDHGVHVAGIAAARKDGFVMHGTAYDADLLSIILSFDSSYEEKLFASQIESLLQYTDIKIANCSWGNGYTWSLGRIVDYDTTWNGAYGSREYNFDAVNSTEYIPMAKVADQNDVLFIFAAGNDGASSPVRPANYPSLVMGTKVIGLDPIAPYDFASDRNNSYKLTSSERRALSLNVISVSAFDPAETTSSLNFVSWFTNMANGATDYTLLAPGSNIYSAVSQSSTAYAYDSGTSMAAPFVSGTAALVQQAFPFMGGKQIADVLLSTATPLALNDLPNFLVRYGRQELHESTHNTFSIIIPYAEGGTPDITAVNLEYHRPELSALWDNIKDIVEDEDLVGGEFQDFLDKIVSLLDEAAAAGEAGYNNAPSVTSLTVHAVTYEEYLQLFGMGIVNAGRAVQGPGWLDAHRLGNDDRQTYGGKAYAMYRVDTQGYDATWSNNIAEVCIGGCNGEGEGNYNYPGYAFGPGYVDPDAAAEFYGELSGLHVGLLKTGAGTLALSGNNTYLGATVVQGGGIALGVAGQGNRVAKLAGDVIVGRDGTFTGNGEVKGDLQFAGKLIPGLIDQPGSVLRVTGNVIASVAATSADQDGAASSSSAVDELAGNGTLIVAIAPGGQVNTLSAGGNIDLSDATVEFESVDGGALPADSFAIASSDTGKVTAPTNSVYTTQQGVTLVHDYSFASDGMKLMAQRTGTRVLPQAKVFSEGHLAGLALLDSSADLVASQGVDAARESLGTAVANGPAVGSFATLSTGSNQYATGSGIDVTSLSLIAGIALGGETEAGNLVIAGFFEYGEGTYDTHNSFSGAASIDGNGNASHMGGGALVGLDMQRLGPGRMHVEGSARGGTVRNSYTSGVRDETGRSVTLDGELPYFSWHLGAGYLWDIREDVSLDMNVRYLHTTMSGESVTLSSGDPLEFEDAVSSQVRLGGRVSWKSNPIFRPYVGLAWHHEFDGGQRAKTNGYDIKVPTMQGDTGVGELGLVARPVEGVPWTIDLLLKGYIGARQGVSGSLQTMYEF